MEQENRGASVVEFLRKHAPDPHAALLRVALQTGIAVEDLQKPEGLTAEQIDRVEDSVRTILGLETLEV
jgi:hypothetical protein